jgi:membrane protein implicated in regulation of membrane protease activity
MTILSWHWLLLGLLLIAAELGVAGGFYILFFGVGALVVGGLALFNLAGGTSMQVLLFSVVSIVSLLLFRNRLLRRFQSEPPRPPVDALIGEIATVTEDLGPGAIGRVELRGTVWTARNVSDRNLLRGLRCRVVGIDGLTVNVRPEGVPS